VAPMEGIPNVRTYGGSTLVRSWIEGTPMHLAKPRDPAYFRAALHLVRRLHAADVLHNDLAKETNWLVTPDGRPALVDFQLASTLSRRGRLARALGHDDLRHLLKHKRTYLPEKLTAREKRILDTPSLPSRVWMATGKKVYRFVTRRVLRWRDREGAGDRAT
jgi:predicted Ser/Thr protein kinase